MTWHATDDRFWCHRKVMAMRQSPHYAEAVALWLLAGSWCSGQLSEQHTGRVPLDVLPVFGIPGWRMR